MDKRRAAQKSRSSVVPASIVRLRLHCLSLAKAAKGGLNENGRHPSSTLAVFLFFDVPKRVLLGWDEKVQRDSVRRKAVAARAAQRVVPSSHSFDSQQRH